MIKKSFPEMMLVFFTGLMISFVQGKLSGFKIYFEKNMNEVIQIVLFMIALIVLAPLLGKYMAKAFMRENHFMKPVFGWLEKSVYRVSGVKSEEEMNWKTYLYGVLLFNLFGMVVLFLLQMFQAYLPLN